MAKKGKTGKRMVRYAVVGLGHIAQVAVLPAFANARNSELTGFVSGSPRKLQLLGDRYGVENRWSYQQYEECLASDKIDAVYIALPNDMHHDFAVAAAKAGVHVLCEKPLAVTARDCEDLIRVAGKNGVKLMTAYRLHFEEANLRASELVKSGKIGEARYFNSCFSYVLTDDDNIRLKKARGGGPLFDIGIYCLNAARYIFRSEPIEVFAMTASSGRRFGEVPEIASCVLRFPGERLATFIASFGAEDQSYYEVVGTKGSLRLEPAYEYVGELRWKLKVGEKESEKSFAARDQFGAEISYFSDCILQNHLPEPSGEEGLIDVRIIQALNDSARRRVPVRIPKLGRKSRPDLSQSLKLPPIKEPDLAAVEAPHD